MIVALALLLAGLAVLRLQRAASQSSMRICPQPGGFEALAARARDEAAYRQAIDGLLKPPKTGRRTSAAAQADLSAAGGWASVPPAVGASVKGLVEEHVRGFSNLTSKLNVVRYRKASTECEASLRRVGDTLATVPRDLPPPNSLRGSLSGGLSGWNQATHMQAASIALPHGSLAAYPVLAAPAVAAVPSDGLTFNPTDAINAGLPAPGSDTADAALESVDTATDTVLDDPAGALDFGVPLAAVFVSGFREGKLLLQDDTEVARAAKNIALDVAGVGLGAKGGAIAGTLIAGPIGTVVGGVIGGIGGKLAAGQAKARPLVRAKEAFNSARFDYNQEETQAKRDLARAWKEGEAAIGGTYNKQLNEISAQVGKLCGGLDSDVLAAAALDKKKLQALLASADKDLSSVLAQAESDLRTGRLLLLRQPAAYFSLRRLNADARIWRREAERVRATWKGSVEETAAAFDLVLAVPDGRDAALGHLTRLGRARQTACRSLADAVSRITVVFAQTRSKAVGELHSQWDTLQRETAERLQAAYAVVETAAASLRIELRKAGKA